MRRNVWTILDTVTTTNVNSVVPVQPDDIAVDMDFDIPNPRDEHRAPNAFVFYVNGIGRNILVAWKLRHDILAGSLEVDDLSRCRNHVRITTDGTA